jgi:hypothetical protein
MKKVRRGGRSVRGLELALSAKEQAEAEEQGNFGERSTPGWSSDEAAAMTRASIARPDVPKSAALCLSYVLIVRTLD